jgi:hypothetical protein
MTRWLICSVIAVVFAIATGLTGQVEVKAATIGWTDWASNYGGTVSGSIGDVSVSYTGEVGGNTRVGAALGSGYPTWDPASTYVGGTVDNAPTYGDIIALNGGNTSVDTVRFSSPVVNPVMAIWSLGQPGSACSYVFSENEPFAIVAGGPNNEYGGSSIYSIGTTVYGHEGNGTIQFYGTFTTLSWTVPSGENWHGFTVGVPVPEPSAIVLLGIGAISLFAWRRRGAGA